MPSNALLHGTAPGGAFLDGYHAGLLVTVALVAAGAVLSYLALRQPRAAEPAPALAPVSPEADPGRPELAEDRRRRRRQ